jgi:hypothetical protein
MGADGCWLHERKHRGFRVLTWKQGERVKVWTRRGADLRIAEAVRGVVAMPEQQARPLSSVRRYLLSKFKKSGLAEPRYGLLASPRNSSHKPGSFSPALTGPATWFAPTITPISA